MSKRTGVMEAVPYDPCIFSGGELIYAQPKLDGIRCRAEMDNGRATLFSSEGNEIVGVPHINRALKRSFPWGSVIFDGELYASLLPQETVSAICRMKRTVAVESVLVSLHVFDIIEDATQRARLVKLETYASRFDSIHVRNVPVMVVESEVEMMTLLNDFIEIGYEGIILRRAWAKYEYGKSDNVMKFKPSRNDEYTIIDIKEEVSMRGLPKGRAGSFIVRDARGNEFCVSARTIDVEEREEILDHPETVRGKMLRIEYMGLTRNGIPRHVTRVEIMEPPMETTA